MKPITSSTLIFEMTFRCVRNLILRYFRLGFVNSNNDMVLALNNGHDNSYYNSETPSILYCNPL